MYKKIICYMYSILHINLESSGDLDKYKFVAELSNFNRGWSFCLPYFRYYLFVQLIIHSCQIKYQ